jgi:hypothetical protein
MMGTEIVPETSVSSCNKLARLCAREDFIQFSRRERLKLYVTLSAGNVHRLMDIVQTIVT